MSKRETYHSNLDKILNVFLSKDVELEEETPEITLEEKTLEDGTVIRYADMNVGTPVVVVDADGVETPAPDGEWMISETEKIVTVDGLISEVMTEEAEAAPEEEVMEEDKPTNSFNIDELKKKLEEKVDLEKEGFYTITLSVANGSFEWGNLYAESFSELKAENEKLEKDLKQAKSDFESQLKVLAETVKKTGVVQAPVETPKVPKSKTELMKARLQKARENNLTN